MERRLRPCGHFAQRARPRRVLPLLPPSARRDLRDFLVAFAPRRSLRDRPDTRFFSRASSFADPALASARCPGSSGRFPAPPFSILRILPSTTPPRAHAPKLWRF